MVDNQSIGPIVAVSVLGVFGVLLGGIAYTVHKDKQEKLSSNGTSSISSSYGGRSRTRRHRRSSRDTRKQR